MVCFLWSCFLLYDFHVVLHMLSFFMNCVMLVVLVFLIFLISNISHAFMCASSVSCQLCPDEVDAAAWLTHGLVRMSVWSKEKDGIDEDTDIPVTLVNKHGGQWRSFVASMRHRTLLIRHAQCSSASFIFFWVLMMMKNCQLEQSVNVG